MLKKIIIQLHQIDLTNPETFHKIKGFEKLLADLKEHDLEIIQLEDSSKLKEEQGKKESLILSDLQETIKACHTYQLPSVAYENKMLLKQDLFKANLLLEGFIEVTYTIILEVYQRFYNEPIVIAKTDRFTIREMILEDLKDLYEIYESEEVTKFLEPLYEREEEIAFTKAYIKNMYGFYGYGLWSLVDNQTGKILGRAGLSNREVDGEIQIELGYMVGLCYQRQGIAYEACKEILTFAVNRLECFFVNCFVHLENYASIKLAEKLGFVYMQEIDIANEKLSWYRWTYEGQEDIMDDKDKDTGGRSRNDKGDMLRK